MPQGNSVGRELVFCISCARLVENVAPRSAKLIQIDFDSHEKRRLRRGRTSLVHGCLTAVSRDAEVILLFLNCTKNIELTCGTFDRTVSFAQHKSCGLSSAAREVERELNRTRQPMHTGQRAMKPAEWKTYRTRFLVKAKQLSSSLSFVDALGRQHSGRKGDYLVESSDGVVSIAPRQIFEDIYVAMGNSGSNGMYGAEAQLPAKTAASGHRKLPQSCRDRGVATSRFGLM
jgi:hypothetical protein